MIEQYAHSLGHYLQANPNMGGLITFLIAFLESLPVIGTIVPGTVTMSAVGLLVGTGILPPYFTLFWAVLGAFLGDLIGYGLGQYYNERLRSMWPFKSRPQWLELGKRFFQKHGGKSIYIGRFIGPLRSLIPLIAGILHMPWQRFVLAAIPASTLWAIVYMLPGYLLGALSLQLPPKLATKFIMILFLMIIILTGFAWLLQLFYSKLLSSYQFYLKKSWHHLEAHPRLSFIPGFTRSTDELHNYHQLTWLLNTLLFSLLFLLILASVFTQSSLTSLNRPVFEFLRTLRHASSDPVFIGFTLLGDSKVLAVSGLIITTWFVYKKYWREAIYWPVTIFISVVLPVIYKIFFYFPRPGGFLHASTASSFPSGHTFQGTLFYGFLATMITTHLESRYRRFVYYAAALIIFLIAFSRLYLGAHWLTDVLASIALGLCCLSLIALCYRRKIYPLNIKQLGLISIIALIAVWSSFFIINFQKNVARYSLLWPSKTIEYATWWSQINPTLPLFRQNRIGKPSEPMNIQYAGDLQQLKTVLASKGWRSSPDVGLLQSTMAKLLNTPNNYNPLLPSLYLNHPPVLFMSKNDTDSQIIIRLWESNVYFAQTWDPIYVGNIIEYQMDLDKEVTLYSFNVTAKLGPYLNKFNWRTTTIQAKTIPIMLSRKHWNGQILQINAPTFY